MTGYYTVSAPVNAEEQCSTEPDDSDYIDFDIEIRTGKRHQYPVSVLNSPGGEVSQVMNWPYTHAELDEVLASVEQLLLRFGGQRRRRLTPGEAVIQTFGASLFDALFAGEIRNLYDVSRERAIQQGCGLRIKLRINEPRLASLPWEYLYDSRHDRYLALSSRTPLVRYLETQLPPRPLIGSVPLRILGMAANPKDASPIDISREKRRVETALRDLIEAGRIELKWTEGSTWQDLQRELLQGPWHVFHFIGHGFFHAAEDEGYVILTDTEGMADALSATKLAHLLADHQALRLVLLNACEGAKAGVRDTLSSTASILIKHGVPAVLAMQYEISNAAAVECARSFYQAVAYGLPVDAATAEARKGMAVHGRQSPEWGVPVLYMRSRNGQLFRTKVEKVTDGAVPETLPQTLEAEEKKTSGNDLASILPGQPDSTGTRRLAKKATSSAALATHSRRSKRPEMSSSLVPFNESNLANGFSLPVLFKREPFRAGGRWQLSIQLWVAIALALGLAAALGLTWSMNLYAAQLVTLLPEGTLSFWLKNGPAIRWQIAVVAPIAWSLMGLLWWAILHRHLSQLGQLMVTIPLTWTVAWVAGLSLPTDLVQLGFDLTGVDLSVLSMVGEPLSWLQSWGLGDLPWVASGATLTGTSLLLMRSSKRDMGDSRLWETLTIGGTTALAMLQNRGLEAWALLLVPRDEIALAGNLAGALVAIQLGYGIQLVRGGRFHPALLPLGILFWSALAGFVLKAMPWMGHYLDTTGIDESWMQPWMSNGAAVGSGVVMMLAPLLFWLLKFERAALFQQLTFPRTMHIHHAFDLIRRRGIWRGERAGEHLIYRSLSRLPLAGELMENFDLRGVSLAGADLSQSHFIDCDLRGANLMNTNLSHSSLAGSDLGGATLARAKAEGLMVARCRYDSQTRWPDAFDYKNSGAIGPGAMLKGEILSGFQLDDADLVGANLGQADLSQASLIGANLERTSLRGTDFKGADLTGAILKGATLKGARYDETTRWPEGFDPDARGALLVTLQA